MRWEEKIPGGKLVCVEVSADGERVGKVRISGDFFLHPEEKIEEMERSLEGLPISSGEVEIRTKLEAALGNAALVGVSPEDLARMFRKAVDG